MSKVKKTEAPKVGADENRVPSARAKAILPELVGRASYAKERTIITRNGKDAAVIVPMEDLALLEKLEDELDAKLAREAIEEMERTGEKPIPAREFFRELGLEV